MTGICHCMVLTWLILLWLIWSHDQTSYKKSPRRRNLPTVDDYNIFLVVVVRFSLFLILLNIPRVCARSDEEEMGEKNNNKISTPDGTKATRRWLSSFFLNPNRISLSPLLGWTRGKHQDNNKKKIPSHVKSAACIQTVTRLRILLASS